MLKEKIDDLLKILTERERRILKLRYGLSDGYTYTIEEIARLFDLTREQVREIETRAVNILKSQYRAPVEP